LSGGGGSRGRDKTEFQERHNRGKVEGLEFKQQERTESMKATPLVEKGAKHKMAQKEMIEPVHIGEGVRGWIMLFLRRIN